MSSTHVDKSITRELLITWATFTLFADAINSWRCTIYVMNKIDLGVSVRTSAHYTIHNSRQLGIVCLKRIYTSFLFSIVIIVKVRFRPLRFCWIKSLLCPGARNGWKHSINDSWFNANLHGRPSFHFATRRHLQSTTTWMERKSNPLISAYIYRSR